MQEKNGYIGGTINPMSENDDECVRLDTRLAGQVRRYHTWPVVGQQTIAEHCWQILRIYLAVTERIDSQMMYHIVFHDIGEHFTGDIPYPVKRDNQQLKEQVDFLEQRSYCTQLDYWGSFEQVRLNDAEKKLFKQIELVEMAEFGLDQVCFGNTHGMIIADRCLRAVYENEPTARLGLYVSKRLKLFYRQWHGGLVEDTDGDWWFEDNWERFNDKSQPEASGGDPLQN